jgi:hypothetical protein
MVMLCPAASVAELGLNPAHVATEPVRTQLGDHRSMLEAYGFVTWKLAILPVWLAGTDTVAGTGAIARPGGFATFTVAVPVIKPPGANSPRNATVPDPEVVLAV